LIRCPTVILLRLPSGPALSALVCWFCRAVSLAGEPVNFGSVALFARAPLASAGPGRVLIQKFDEAPCAVLLAPLANCKAVGGAFCHAGPSLAEPLSARTAEVRLAFSRTHINAHKQTLPLPS